MQPRSPFAPVLDLFVARLVAQRERQGRTVVSGKSVVHRNWLRSGALQAEWIVPVQRDRAHWRGIKRRSDGYWGMAK